MSLILVVDDESDVEMLFRQQFRRELRAGRFRIAAPARNDLTNFHWQLCLPPGTNSIGFRDIRHSLNKYARPQNGGRLHLGKTADSFQSVS